MKVAPGTRFGPYEIVSSIGAGGMGHVYQAKDVRLQRDVAVKILTDRLAADPKNMARLRREAQTIASLSHPNILAVYDVGEESGHFFVVMELLDGATLRDVLRRGALSADQAVGYATQVAAGLRASHGRGIVHRDLKPENLMISAFDQLKILDFGLAKASAPLPGSDEDTVSFEEVVGTEPGAVVGTVGYMSPEQARGFDADSRSDIFALGVVMYEMLSGINPYLRDSKVETLHAILVESPAPLSTLMPAIPEPVSRLVHRCLEKQPDLRFQDGEELSLAFRSLGGQAGSTVSGAAATPDLSLRASLPSVAVLPFTDMSPDGSQAYFCEGMSEDLITALGKVVGLRTVARTSAFQFRDRDVDIRRIGDTLNVDTVLEGSVRVAAEQLRVVVRLVDARQGYQVWSKRFDRRMADIFSVQDEISAQVVSALEVTLSASRVTGFVPAPTREIEAYHCFLEGRHQWNRRTEDGLERSLGHYRQAIEIDPAFARAHAAVAASHVTLGTYGARAPGTAMEEGRRAALRALELDGDLAEAHAVLGAILAVYDWSWDDAEEAFERAIRLGPKEPTTHQWYGVNCLVPRGRFEAARARLDAAVDVDPLSLVVRASQGITSYYAGEFDRAVDELQRTLELDPNFVMARYFLGLTHAAAGRLDPARTEAEAAVTLSAGAPEMVSALGYVQGLGGDAVAARAALERLEGLSRERYVSPLLLAQVHAGLGEVEPALGQVEAALAERAVDMAWCAVRPVFATVRTEPRFAAVIERVGVAP